MYTELKAKVEIDKSNFKELFNGDAHSEISLFHLRNLPKTLVNFKICI